MFKALMRSMALALIFCLALEQSGFAQAVPQMPIPAYINGYVAPDKFRPVQLRSFSFDSTTQNFDLFLDPGDARTLAPKKIELDTKLLMSYFRIGLALPNTSFWVNLRPDAPLNIIDQALEKTDLGRVMLAADLELKKSLARFTSPKTEEGKKYWDRLYARAEQLFSAEDCTIPTVTRPWIVPGEVIIKETPAGCHILKATLKVCLEEDRVKTAQTFNFEDPRLKELNEYSSQLIRDIVIPTLTREVNSSKKFSSLRQVFYSLILAQWFKEKHREGEGYYAKSIDSGNLEGLESKKRWSKDSYFKAYKKSFEQGEYNLSESSGSVVRQYVSGGITGLATALTSKSFMNGPASTGLRVTAQDGGIALRGMLHVNTAGEIVTSSSEGSTHDFEKHQAQDGGNKQKDYLQSIKQNLPKLKRYVTGENISLGLVGVSLGLVAAGMIVSFLPIIFFGAGLFIADMQVLKLIGKTALERKKIADEAGKGTFWVGESLTGAYIVAGAVGTFLSLFTGNLYIFAAVGMLWVAGAVFLFVPTLAISGYIYLFTKIFNFFYTAWLRSINSNTNDLYSGGGSEADRSKDGGAEGQREFTKEQQRQLYEYIVSRAKEGEWDVRISEWAGPLPYDVNIAVVKEIKKIFERNNLTPGQIKEFRDYAEKMRRFRRWHPQEILARLNPFNDVFVVENLPWYIQPIIDNFYLLESDRSKDEAADGGVQVVTLRNGAEEAAAVVKVTMMSLRLLCADMGTIPAFWELVNKARDPAHPIQDEEVELLKRFSLIQSDGSMHGSVRNIVLSAATDDALPGLRSPFIEADGGVTWDENMATSVKQRISDSQEIVNDQILQTAKTLEPEALKAFLTKEMLATEKAIAGIEKNQGILYFGKESKALKSRAKFLQELLFNPLNEQPRLSSRNKAIINALVSDQVLVDVVFNSAYNHNEFAALVTAVEWFSSYEDLLPPGFSRIELARSWIRRLTGEKPVYRITRDNNHKVDIYTNKEGDVEGLLFLLGSKDEFFVQVKSQLMNIDFRQDHSRVAWFSKRRTDVHYSLVDPEASVLPVIAKGETVTFAGDNRSVVSLINMNKKGMEPFVDTFVYALGKLLAHEELPAGFSLREDAGSVTISNELKQELDVITDGKGDISRLDFNSKDGRFDRLVVEINDGIVDVKRGMEKVSYPIRFAEDDYEKMVTLKRWIQDSPELVRPNAAGRAMRAESLPIIMAIVREEIGNRINEGMGEDNTDVPKKIINIQNRKKIAKLEKWLSDCEYKAPATVAEQNQALISLALMNKNDIFPVQAFVDALRNFLAHQELPLGFSSDKTLWLSDHPSAVYRATIRNERGEKLYIELDGQDRVSRLQFGEDIWYDRLVLTMDEAGENVMVMRGREQDKKARNYPLRFVQDEAMKVKALRQWIQENRENIFTVNEVAQAYLAASTLTELKSIVNRAKVRLQLEVNVASHGIGIDFDNAIKSYDQARPTLDKLLADCDYKEPARDGGTSDSWNSFSNQEFIERAAVGLIREGDGIIITDYGKQTKANFAGLGRDYGGDTLIFARSIGSEEADIRIKYNVDEIRLDLSQLSLREKNKKQQLDRIFSFLDRFEPILPDSWSRFLGVKFETDFAAFRDYSGSSISTKLTRPASDLWNYGYGPAPAIRLHIRLQDEPLAIIDSLLANSTFLPKQVPADAKLRDRYFEIQPARKRWEEGLLALRAEFEQQPLSQSTLFDFDQGKDGGTIGEARDGGSHDVASFYVAFKEGKVKKGEIVEAFVTDRKITTVFNGFEGNYYLPQFLNLNNGDKIPVYAIKQVLVSGEHGTTGMTIDDFHKLVKIVGINRGTVITVITVEKQQTTAGFESFSGQELPGRINLGQIEFSTYAVKEIQLSKGGKSAVTGAGGIFGDMDGGSDIDKANRRVALDNAYRLEERRYKEYHGEDLDWRDHLEIQARALTRETGRTYAVIDGHIEERDSSMDGGSVLGNIHMVQSIVQQIRTIAEKSGVVGGIDFIHALPVQPSLIPALMQQSVAPNMPVVSLQALDRQWLDIQEKISQGRMPYEELKTLSAGCCGRDDAVKQKEAVADYVLNLLKLEEERAIETPAQLKEIIPLVVS